MTSDHGDGLGAHPELGHSISVWEEQLRIPLLVRFPDGSRGGEVFTEQTTLTALMPSLLDWLWGTAPSSPRRVPRFGAGGTRPDYRRLS